MYSLLVIVACTVLVSLVSSILTPALAQQRDASLRVTIVDPLGAVIIGATVEIAGHGSAPFVGSTDAVGVATFDALAPGTWSLRVSSPGFAQLSQPVVLKRGVNRLELQLQIEHFIDEIVVTRDPREAATDPAGETLTVTLDSDALEALPDAPEELEQVLQELAGPGADVNVDGFQGSAPPSKDRIQEIRVRRAMYSAESHNRSSARVEIVTKPGTERWQSNISFGFRTDALNARNAFAASETPEQLNRLSAIVQGPLVRNRTSLSAELDGLWSYESRTIQALSPTGFIQGVVRQPRDRLNIEAHVLHALTRTHMARVEYRERHGTQQNLGVGDFDQPERAYSRIETRRRFRLGSTSVYERSLNEFRWELEWDGEESSAATEAQTIRILDTLTRGGANIRGGRREGSMQLTDKLNFRLGSHAVGVGGRLDWLNYRSDEIRNPHGTFTFSTLDDYDAGRPIAFTQRRGDPSVRYSMMQAAWFLQDDIQLGKTLSVGLGLRHEWQSHLDEKWNLAPRFGLAWTPSATGRTTVRGAAGIFHEWYEGSTYEETLQVDGTRVQELTVQFPGYPDPFAAGILDLLPVGRVQQARTLRMPTVRQGTVAIERRLGSGVRLNASYAVEDAVDMLRARNVNPPDVNGTRPDAGLGNVIEIQSIGRERRHELAAGVSGRPWQRLFLTARYAWASGRDDGDGPLALPAEHVTPNEWGPSSDDIRHQLSGFGSLALRRNLQVGLNLRLESAPPYTITTGRDDNGDALFNDRPPGAARNGARGEGALRLDLRLSWRVGAGQTGRSGRDSQGDGRSSHRVTTELYVRALNVLNTVNKRGFSGVLSSPFFGKPTFAEPARRVEVGIQIAM